MTLGKQFKEIHVLVHLGISKLIGITEADNHSTEITNRYIYVIWQQPLNLFDYT